MAEDTTHGYGDREPLRTGSEALLSYPEGDADVVTIVALNGSAATVRLPSGSHRIVPIESIGIGVDDAITAVFDDGTTWPTAEAALRASVRADSPGLDDDDVDLLVQVRKAITERRTAKDPEAFVRDLHEAGQTLGWAGKRFEVALVSIDGETASGRKRFTIRITHTDEDVR